MNNQYPLARSKNLVTQDLPDEILAYDLETNRAHRLNESAAFIWSVCDGRRSISQIERLTSQKFGQTVGEDFILLAISFLDDNKLLELRDEVISVLPEWSRRQMIRRAGLASMVALPLIASIVAPKAAAAASIVADNCFNAGLNFCTDVGGCPTSCNACIGDGTCGSANQTCSNLGASCDFIDFCSGIFGCSNGGSGGNCDTVGQPCGTAPNAGVCQYRGTCGGNPCSAPGDRCIIPSVCRGSGLCANI